MIANEIYLLIEDFRKVAELAGVNFSSSALSFEYLTAPHKPPSIIPKGKSAVYVFLWNDICLKVGRVGPNSKTRYTSQHYNPSSSNSNLAKSIVSASSELGLPDISEINVGDWIKSNVDRVNFLLDLSYGIPVLTILESFLQCRLKPYFEGFKSQR